MGVVDEVGDGVTTVQPGQPVAALLGDEGGYAETVCVSAETAVPVPAGVDPSSAVCLVANYVTAWSMMDRAAQGQGDGQVLVHGAAGGVGTALLEVGRLHGLEILGTASAHNHDVVRRMGATPIDYRTEERMPDVPCSSQRRSSSVMRRPASEDRGRAAAGGRHVVPAWLWGARAMTAAAAAA